MDRAELLHLFDARLRRDAAPDGPGTEVERAGDVVRQTGGPDDWNGVLWSALDEAGADAAIAEAVRHYRGRGLDFEWKLYGHDGPADLGARLAAAGFRPEPPETVMVAAVADLSTETVLPEGLEMREVTDEAGVDLVVRAHEAAFGADATGVRHRMLAQLPHGLCAVVVLDGDRPVCAARMELPAGQGDFATLWGGGTAPDQRGRGLYRATVAARARVAAARGHRFLQVDALPTSRPILTRLGFTPLTTTTPYAYTV